MFRRVYGGDRMFKLDTPSNVNEMQREEAVKLVKPRAGMPSLKNRTIIYESLMRIFFIVDEI